MRKTIAIASITIALSGCVQSATQEPAKSIDSSPREGTVVKFLDRCITQTVRWSDPSAKIEAFPAIAMALATQIVPVLVNKTVNLTTSYLKELRNDLNATSSATFSETFYSPTGASNFGCIAFLRGSLGTADSFRKAEHNNPEWPRHRLLALRADDHPVQRQFPVSAAPKVYAEFQVVYLPAEQNAEKSAFYLKPVYLYYSETAAKRSGSGKKNLLFSFVIEAPAKADAKETTKALANFNIPLGEVPIGTLWPRETLIDKASSTMAIPAPTPDNKRLAMTLKGTLVETEDASTIEKLLTDTLDEKKSDIGKAIGDAIVKAMKESGE